MDQNSIYFKQVQLLIEILPYVKMDNYFALKGGTAINLFIRDLLPFENIKDLPSVKWKQLNLDKMDSKSRLEALEKLKKVLFG